jgi:hypothetical protein
MQGRFPAFRNVLSMEEFGSGQAVLQRLASDLDEL